VRGRLVLLALVLVALPAALAGCGGGDDGKERREAVAEYIRAVNTTQQRFASVYGGADGALRAFGAKGTMGGKTADELAAAAATMRDVRGALVRIEPPAEGRKLHGQLLLLLDLQTRLTRDLSQMARYLPSASAALRSAELARAKLQQSLERSSTVPGQTAAARAYSDDIEEALGDLQGLTPPPVLATWHKGQAKLLRTSSQLGDGLAAGLESGDREQIEGVLRRFQGASRDAAAVARAQVLAVRSFNARVKTQRALVRKIVQEQRRLDRTTS
jgi:hypothetical protein